MPSRNRIKIYAPDTYYHVYNRGVERRLIFKDSDDYAVFLNLLKRYLSGKEEKDKFGRPYKDLSDAVELLAFCLMPNHFHLFLYQIKSQGMTELLQRVSTAYVRYFNNKYQREGPLFQDRFKASFIGNDAYLWHISRYIHLNPNKLARGWRNYTYSSLPYYLDNRKTAWVKPRRVLELHKEQQLSYNDFMADWEDYKSTLSEYSPDLAVN